jgi:type IV pilus assembly protein PilY1
MKRNHILLIRRLLAYGLAANLAVQPAFAQVTISQLPLASAGGNNILPNLLFTLDNSGSMDWQFVPDYVDPGTVIAVTGTNSSPNNPCMSTSTGSTTCVEGDPPYSAGGEFAMNGVGYDPNFTYLAGIDANGQPHVNPPNGTLAPATTPKDAYTASKGNIDVTSQIPDRKYCNSFGVCMRNGQTDASPPATLTANTLVSGTDDSGHAMSAGQFPYRTNKSNASFKIVSGAQTMVFGLPEMMPIGTFTRSGATVTATTVEAHGLTTSDKVFVTSGTTGLSVTCVAVNSTANANTFTYTSGSSGAIAATTASYRKCDSGNFSKASGTVTVNTAVAHGLVSNDVITTFVPTSSAMSANGVTVTVVSATQFTYGSSGGTTIASTAGFWVRNGLYNVTSTVNGPALAYRIVPVEYCADPNLTDCIEVIPPAAPPADHPFPAYVRFCRTQEEALAHGAVSFIATTPRTNRCQLKYVNLTGLQTYQFPRYGWFVRDTIKSTVASYSGRPGRIECAAAPVCTYTEEIQNYAKWYAYYRTRMQMMKTSVGISFRGFISNPTGTPPKPDSLRVGFITIHAADSGSVAAAQYLRIDNFNTTQANNLYTKFYLQTPGGFTPLRESLSRAGWIFAGKLGTGLTTGIPAADDPIQSSCQKNYSLLTTDGFWNSNAGQDIAGAAVGNWDNIDNNLYTPAGVTPAYTDPVSSRATGTYDGNILPGTVAGTNPGGSGTLADVALYYYMTDLRGGTDRNNKPTGPATSPNTTPPNGNVAANNIPSKAGNKDFAQHQHMVTFTLGLADGLMLYDPNYETVPGDFANIKNGVANVCFWAAGVCNWPAPQQDKQTALDDLWHAAVNGRGTYFLALNPKTLANALQNALSNIAGRTASAAAAATSSPNITPKDNFAFSTTYQTNTWSGIVKANRLDAVTGAVLVDAQGKPIVLWEADVKLLTQVGANADSRNVLMLDTSSATKLKPFQFVGMTPAEQAFFMNKCASMTQCGLLSLPQKAVVNAGTALVGFLRGQTGNEAVLFRDRVETDPVTNVTLQTVLGDIVDATPAYIRVPEFSYTDTGYSSFKTANASRPGALYVAANDGYLHGFDNSTDVNGNPTSTAGTENFAYMPKFVMPGIYQIADTGYANAHRFMLDGSPEIGDVFDATASVWRTIVVGGANGGARGFYALDITDPKNPKGLWEFCSDSTLCPAVGTVSHSDSDLGFTYGNPVIGKRAFDGRWVVVLTSGLNNVSPGSGVGFFYVLDAITGQVLDKVSTGAGNTITPLGLMRQGGYFKAGLVDAKMDFVYGGDLQGNVWRIDMSTSPPALMHMATLKDGAGNPQPITVRPVVTNINNNRVYYVGTGRYLASTDPSDTSQQSIYGFKDKDADYGTNIRAANLVTQTLTAGSTRTITNNTVDWSTQDGFVIDLNPGNDSPGERIVLDPRLELGTLVFASNVPIVGGCTPGGDSFVYNLDFSSGSYVPGAVNNTAGVRQGAFLVGFTPIQTTDGSIRTVNTDSAGGLGTGSVNINRNPKGISRFSYRER